MIALGFVFAVAALHAPRGAGARAYAVLGALAALTGMGISGWHVRLQNLPPAEVPACGPGFDYIMDAFGWLDGLRDDLHGLGRVRRGQLGVSRPQHAGLGLRLVRRARRPRHRRQLVARPR